MKNLIRNTAVVLAIILLTSSELQSQTFTEQTAINLPAVSNGSVSWGDFDNDGDADLLISGIKQDNSILLKIFRNTAGSFADMGDLIFSPAVPGNYASYGVTFRADWADLNNDNYLDIVTAGPASDGSSEITVYRNNANSTFTKAYSSGYLTFQGGSSFDFGDYDNDGDADILLAGSLEIKILKNKGSFAFADDPAFSLPGMQYPSSRWIDYDNDGDVDIVLSGQLNSSYKTLLYQNQGNSSFIQQANLGGSGFTDIGDYNNDGFADMIVGSSNIYQNNGNGTFTKLTGITLPYLNGVQRWCDIDNDGDNDIVMTGSNKSTIFRNNGNNTFTEITGTGLSGFTEAYLAPGDYDNDGDLDLVISGIQGPSKFCKLFRNDITVANTAPAAPATPAATLSGNDMILSWSPVTTDNTASAAMSYNIQVGTTPGASDIVNASSSSAGYFRKSVMGNGQLGTSFVLRNIPKTNYYWKVQAVDNSFRSGPFSIESTFTYNASVQAYGLNVTDKGGTKSTLEWSRGNGTGCAVFMMEGSTGTFVPVNGVTYTASSVMGSSAGTWYCIYKGTGSSVQVTNLKPKTAYIFKVFEYDAGPVYNAQVSSNNTLSFTTNTFTDIGISLPAITVYSIGTSAKSSTYWFDSDNDNDLDLLLLGTSSAYLYRNDGGNVFTSVPSFGIPGGYSASLGDYDNDGYTDILMAGNTGIYRNNHDNTFVKQAITFPDLYYGSVAWNDYDNDGNLDFVLCGDVSTQGKKTFVYRNKGNGTFALQELIMLDGVAFGAVKWLDYDNDGFNDVLISGADNSAKQIASLYRNNGKDNFIKQDNAVISGGTTSTIDCSDYDSDGDLDLLVGDFNFTKLYRNDGNNVFTEVTGINLKPTGYGSATWGDYDNDGDPDILLAGFYPSYQPFAAVYRNNGDNSFTEDLSCVLPGAGFGSASWGDYDNDGDLDLVIAGNDADKAFSKIFRNDIVPANVKPAAPSSPSSTVNKSDVTLKWKSVRSDQTNYKSISYNIKVSTSSGGINVVSPHSNPATGYRKIIAQGNAGPDTVFYLKNLPFATYYWSVQAIDNNFAGSSFSSEGTFQVVPVQASKLSATIVNKNSLLLKWERGNGDRCAVFCKQASSGTASPVNNTGYIADPEFGFGGQIGTSGWYCVFNGRADSVTVKGLVFEKEYSFHVIEYTGSYGSENYFTNVVDGNPGVFTTSLFAKQTGIVLPNGTDSPPAWGDYDNDGFVDLLLPGDPSKIYRNNGNNTFTDIGAVLPSVFHGYASWGDYDNDNDLDFIITGASVNYPASGPTVKLYRNNGSNSFTEQASPFTPVYYSSAEWYDYNGDGYLDMLLTGATGTDPAFNPVSKIYRNNGNSTFTEQVVSLTGIYKGAAKWFDYDNDGDPDIILGGVLDYDENHNTLKIYRNDGNNSFTQQNISALTGFPKMSISCADFDNDGDVDIMISSYYILKVFKNNGNNQFTEFYMASYGYQDAAGSSWWDYDNDGYPDIISTRPGLNTEIYRNETKTNGTFRRQDDEAFTAIGYRFVTISDYDNDGDNDVILSKDGPSVVFRNNTIMKSGLFKPNASPEAPAGITAVNSPAGVLLKWNPSKDDVTPSKTLMYNVKLGSASGSENISPSNSGSTGFRKIPLPGNAFTDTTFLLKSMPAGTYYWKVQSTDHNYKGSAWSAEGTFEVRNVQAFFSATEVCNGKPTTFTDQSVATSGITAWKWYFSDGTTSTARNPVHTYADGGTYNVKLVVTDATGKKDSLVHAVNVKGKPVTAFDAPSVCEGTAVTFTNNTNANGLTVSAWSWNFGDASTSSVRDPGPHPYLSLANFNVSLKAVAANGCADSITKSVSIVSRPSAAITVAGTASFCQGKSVTLSTTKNPEYTYSWKLEDTEQTGGNSDTFIANTAGSYTVKITNPTGNCWSTSAPVNVVVKPSPLKPVFQAQNYTQGQCPGEHPVKLGVQNIQGYNYRWMMNGILLPKETSSSIEFYEPGNYRLIADLNGCTDTSSVFTAQFPQGPEKPVIYAEGPTAWYLATSVMNARYYKWYYNGNLVEGADKYYYMANRNEGIYQVSVGDANGCYTKSDSIFIGLPVITTGIDDPENISAATIYPNPSDGLLFIELQNNYNGKIKVEVFSPEGKKVFSREFEKNDNNFRETIDLSGQPEGYYLVNIYMNNNRVTKKVMIK